MPLSLSIIEKEKFLRYEIAGTKLPPKCDLKYLASKFYIEAHLTDFKDDKSEFRIHFSILANWDPGTGSPHSGFFDAIRYLNMIRIHYFVSFFRADSEKMFIVTH